MLADGSLLHGYVTASPKAGKRSWKLSHNRHYGAYGLWTFGIAYTVEADKELAVLFRVQLLVFRFSIRRFLSIRFEASCINIGCFLLYNNVYNIYYVYYIYCWHLYSNMLDYFQLITFICNIDNKTKKSRN